MERLFRTIEALDLKTSAFVLAFSIAAIGLLIGGSAIAIGLVGAFAALAAAAIAERW